MSQVSRSLRVLTVGCAVLAALAVGCSKDRGVPFDPDAGHPDDFVTTHSTYVSAGGGCTDCHGGDLRGGISGVSCSTSSFDGQSCHPGGPGGHPDGWRATHTATDPDNAATCAVCHDNSANDLAPNCFNNSLCHGEKSGHPSGWLSSHTSTDTSRASSCAECHQSNAGTPGCYNNTLCHGEKSNHPDGWRSSHTGTATSQASYCAECHQSNAGTPGCYNNTLCHGTKSNHPDGWRTSHTGTDTGQASTCAACHQSNAGTPGCFNNTLCHGEKGGHPAGWSAASQHGATAKAAPGAASGMGSCKACHGSSYGGGTGQSCLICHGGNAPHPKNNWRGEGGRHTSVNTGNTAACAQCHSQLAGSSNCLQTNGCHEGD